MFPCVLQCGRERRGGGFDGGAEFREHGEDAAKHGGGEKDGEERSLAHGECLSVEVVGRFKKLFSGIGCLGMRIS